MKITDFLLTRIAVDEDGTARAYQDLAEALRNQGMASTASWLEDQGARVLAECEAKRRIIELHDETHECVGAGPGGWMGVGDDAEPCPTLRVLAAVYADHPDYEEGWRP